MKQNFPQFKDPSQLSDDYLTQLIEDRESLPYLLNFAIKRNDQKLINRVLNQNLSSDIFIEKNELGEAPFISAIIKYYNSPKVLHQFKEYIVSKPCEQKKYLTPKQISTLNFYLNDDDGYITSFVEKCCPLLYKNYQSLDICRESFVEKHIGDIEYLVQYFVKQINKKDSNKFKIAQKYSFLFNPYFRSAIFELENEDLGEKYGELYNQNFNNILLAKIIKAFIIKYQNLPNLPLSIIMHDILPNLFETDKEVVFSNLTGKEYFEYIMTCLSLAKSYISLNLPSIEKSPNILLTLNFSQNEFGDCLLYRQKNNECYIQNTSKLKKMDFMLDVKQQLKLSPASQKFIMVDTLQTKIKLIFDELQYMQYIILDGGASITFMDNQGNEIFIANFAPLKEICNFDSSNLPATKGDTSQFIPPYRMALVKENNNLNYLVVNGNNEAVNYMPKLPELSVESSLSVLQKIGFLIFPDTNQSLDCSFYNFLCDMDNFEDAKKLRKTIIKHKILNTLSDIEQYQVVRNYLNDFNDYLTDNNLNNLNELQNIIDNFKRGNLVINYLKEKYIGDHLTNENKHKILSLLHYACEIELKHLEIQLENAENTFSQHNLTTEQEGNFTDLIDGINYTRNYFSELRNQYEDIIKEIGNTGEWNELGVVL